MTPPPTESTADYAREQFAIDLSPRAMAVGLMVFVAMAASLRFISDSTAVGAAIKVVVAGLAVGVIPGALVTLLWWPRPNLGFLEWLAISIAVSFGLGHLITVFMILAHVGVPTMAVALPVVWFGAALWLLLRGTGRGPSISLGRDEVFGVALLAVAGSYLYIQGSPAVEWEDQVHVSIVRRLAALAQPALDNMYLQPGVVYTYPFPSTHAFMALVTRIAGTDALFVYHKLRFFWGPAALVMIYLSALAVFGKRAVAAAAFVTAGLLMLFGVFATVSGSYWGQLAPYSHASDVAMAVMLPGLLALSFRFIDSDEAAERRFLLPAALALVFALSVVHVREVVQYCAYLGCFMVVAFACSGFRIHARRAAVLLATSLALAGIFLAWHSREVGHITNLVAERRDRIVGIATEAFSRDARNLLFVPSWSILPSYVQWVDAAFHGATQLLLLAGPLVIVAFRRRPLVWLMAASTLVYLLVMTVPALAVPYMYFTYYEILITPIRNLTPFLYLLAGPLLYVVTSWLWSAARWRVVASVTLLAAGAALGTVAFLAPLAANQSEAGFFVPVMLAWATTFLFLGRAGAVSNLTRTRSAAAVVIGALALVALLPDHPPTEPPVPVNVRWTSGLAADTRAALEQRFSLTEGEATSNPETWVYHITDVSVANVQALVTHQDVKDTHHIDRSTFAVELPPRPWTKYPDRTLLLVTGVALWFCGFCLPLVFVWAQPGSSGGLDRFLSAPFHRRAAIFGLFLVPFVFVTASRDEVSPVMLVPVQPFGRVDTPRAILPQIECTSRENVSARLGETYEHGPPVIIPKVAICPPSQGVVDWIRQNVSVQGVFAMDRWNAYLPTVFLSQQIVAFSGPEFSLPSEDELYADYMRLYKTRIREHGVQPFFNDLETLDDRKDYVRSLGVTHVLVDPPYYDLMRKVLDGLPEMFSLKVTDGRWAVYEVRGS
ncbi:MAG: hypothetical protein ABL993_06325 [Vicinamibacterales bacterium]